MHKPKFIPKGQMLVGALVDVNKTRGGIELPEGEMKNVTILMRVDAVGPEVKRAQVGEFIVYAKCFHVQLRDGTHAAVVYDSDVWLTVEGLDPATMSIEGETQPGQRGPQMPRMVSR